MSTEYTYYPDPHEAPVLDTQPLDLSSADQETIRDLVSTSAIAVRAAHVYNRKGFFATDDFTGTPSPAYRSGSDDIVVQVTLLVPDDHAHLEKYQALTDIYTSVQAAKHDAEVLARRDAVARAEADLAAAQARLIALRNG